MKVFPNGLPVSQMRNVLFVLPVILITVLNVVHTPRPSFSCSATVLTPLSGLSTAERIKRESNVQIKSFRDAMNLFLNAERQANYQDPQITLANQLRAHLK